MYGGNNVDHDGGDDDDDNDDNDVRNSSGVSHGVRRLSATTDTKWCDQQAGRQEWRTLTKSRTMPCDGGGAARSRSVAQVLTQSITHSANHPLSQSVSHSVRESSQSVSQSVSQSLAHSLFHSLTHTLTHSRTHGLIHPHMRITPSTCKVAECTVLVLTHAWCSLTHA
jgi:hypothetical protein